MATLQSLSIKHFRGIPNFFQTFPNDFICFIGRGDSGKSTLLEAISLVLSPNWNVPIYDNDFFDCDTSKTIEIEAVVKNLPVELLKEDKFGLFLRGLNPLNNILTDDIEDDLIPVLTIRLTVTDDLEPKWNVITSKEEKPISANDRGKLGVFLISDYIDRHFTWSKGSPLYTLLQQETSEDENDKVMIDALRDAKKKIDGATFAKFDAVTAKVKTGAAALGLDITKSATTIDFKEIVIKDGKVSLHDELIPFRLKGKGSKRLVSMAIQSAIAENGGIILIDELEQGLEPDRVQQLVNSLAKKDCQVFITTHSRDVLVELTTANLLLMRKSASALVAFDTTLQGSLRKNPEAFFAHKVIVCEGATEIGIGKALNEFRIAEGKTNAAFKGIRFADGSGSEMINYAAGFKKSGFPVCLFCDSDLPEMELKKTSLATAGIDLIDWDAGDSLEDAVFKEINFDLLKDLFTLAISLEHQENGTDTSLIQTNMWAVVQNKFGTGCAANLASAADSPALRKAISTAAAKGGWFKTQDKGYKLGQSLFGSMSKLGSGKLLTQLLKLSDWMN